MGPVQRLTGAGACRSLEAQWVLRGEPHKTNRVDEHLDRINDRKKDPGSGYSLISRSIPEFKPKITFSESSWPPRGSVRGILAGKRRTSPTVLITSRSSSYTYFTFHHGRIVVCFELTPLDSVPFPGPQSQVRRLPSANTRAAPCTASDLHPHYSTSHSASPRRSPLPQMDIR